MQTLHGSRVLLRPWRDEDIEAFVQMHSDPAVMEFLPALTDRHEIEVRVGRMRGNLASNGFGLFAVELPEIAPFIGFVGLNAVTFDTHFTPAVEIAWRLASAHWGHGYATEAGRLVLEDGFQRLDLPEIVSFTTEQNLRSRRVMDRLGMTWDADGGFLHPRLPEGHNLSKHVLYRLKRSDFEQGKITKVN